VALCLTTCHTLVTFFKPQIVHLGAFSEKKL
jgi:hypothetical protein